MCSSLTPGISPLELTISWSLHFKSYPAKTAQRHGLAFPFHVNCFKPLTTFLLQSVRTYATEAPKPSSSSTPFLVGGAAIGAGVLGYSFLGSSKKAPVAPPKPADDAKAAAPVARTFTGGDQGFIDLKLADVVDYNHNTKVLKFELPDPEHVSGLSVACKSIGTLRHAYEEI